jgi:hypothetical protein
VPCLPDRPRFHRGALLLGTLLLSASCATAAARLRGASPYRAPAIVLAYPERGTALLTDKAVVVIRFAPREADDPIDVSSFKATVDGVDRTGQFRVTSTEAWGTLGDSSGSASASPETRITSGPHTLGARVCSARGVCGALTVVVEVRPWDRALGPGQLARGRPAPHHTVTVSRGTAAQGSGHRTDTGV